MAELSTLARPYAKAAFEYASDENALSEWMQELGIMAVRFDDFAVLWKIQTDIKDEIKFYTAPEQNDSWIALRKATYSDKEVLLIDKETGQIHTIPMGQVQGK